MPIKEYQSNCCFPKTVREITFYNQLEYGATLARCVMLGELLILSIQFSHVENRTTHRNYLRGLW